MTSNCNRIDGLSRHAPALAGYGVLPVGVRTLTMTNPRQVDVLDPKLRLCDRELTIELWYPAECDTALTPQAGGYDTLLRDGATQIRLYGRALRDVAALNGDYPLVILSHGYPGNRMLLAHFGETLASRGYRVASIDHRDSTYDDKAAFVSTLLNRPFDTRFVADKLDPQSYAIIGYSMGGYGALLSGGALLSELAVSEHGKILAQHQEHSVDPRLKAIIPIGPWGGQRGYFDAAGLSQLRVAMLMMSGSADDISGYNNGMRRIFTESAGPRHLLTFVGAGHNAAAPYPAPKEAFAVSPHLDFLPAEHYADPIWDTVLMNGIAQHFATAFLGLHLKSEPAMAEFLTDFAKIPAGATDMLRLESLG